MSRPDSQQLERLPWRGLTADDQPSPDRPDLPLPPGRVPLFSGPRMRKHWRYVGIFAEDLFLCAARIQIGAFGQTFWCVVDREAAGGPQVHERSALRAPGARGEVFTEGGEIGGTSNGCLTRIESPQLQAKLRFSSGPWVEHVSPTEEGRWSWTRKRAGIPIEVDIRVGDRRIQTTATGIEDESSGYHARETSWFWSAGVGTAADGEPVAWNLVTGLNDPERESERVIWRGEEITEPAPVSFDGLDGVDFADGSRLDFEAEAERSHSERFLIVSSSYRAPFGTFTGALERGIVLERGYGVMEQHDARW